jgi:hypothetical protein
MFGITLKTTILVAYSAVKYSNTIITITAKLMTRRKLRII